MRRILPLFLIVMMIPSLTFCQVLNVGMSGAQTRAAINNAFSETLGIVDTLNETIRINGISVSAGAAEINLLHGLTANTAELNILDGVLANYTEINRLVGVTANIQTQINAKAALASPQFSGYPRLSTDTLATRAYARAYGGDVGAITARVEAIEGILVDTVGIGEVLQVDLDTDTLATRAYARGYAGTGSGTGETQELGTVAPLLLDVKTHITMGLGHAVLGDTIVFVNGALAGICRWTDDPLVVTAVYNVLDMGVGTESLSLQVYWGSNYKTAVDSLFTSPQTITSLTGASITTFNNDTIPKNMTVWGIIRGIALLNKPSLLGTSIIGYIQNQ